MYDTVGWSAWFSPDNVFRKTTLPGFTCRSTYSFVKLSGG
jgi:hypothetical protein